jgi:hypothetical protein
MNQYPVILEEIRLEPETNKIITEYDPKYCDLYIEYAKCNMNPDGFWGKYMIDESVKNIWTNQYPEFKRTVALIPHITTNLLNSTFQSVIDRATDQNDNKTLAQMTNKFMDVHYRVEKDSGLIKDRGNERRKAKQNDMGDILDKDFENMKDYVADNE